MALDMSAIARGQRGMKPDVIEENVLDIFLIKSSTYFP
jgi:hypothetical protein